MQIAILAGGIGRRMRPLTEKVPKSMIRIRNKPFLQYQIELVRRNEIHDIVLCVGYLADRIKEYFKDGRKFGVNIKYSEEREKLLGTAGALKNAQHLLQEEFFVMYGDSFLLLDYSQIMSYFKQFNKLSLMVVYKNYNRYDRSNVILEENLVKVYNKQRMTSEMNYIDEGLSVLRRKTLDLIPENQVFSLEEFFGILIRQKEMLAYETKQRFHEIGSFKGLEEFNRLIKSTEIIS